MATTCRQPLLYGLALDVALLSVLLVMLLAWRAKRSATGLLAAL